jgi:hypothetical protein
VLRHGMVAFGVLHRRRLRAQRLRDGDAGGRGDGRDPAADRGERARAGAGRRRSGWTRRRQAKGPGDRASRGPGASADVGGITRGAQPPGRSASHTSRYCGPVQLGVPVLAVTGGAARTAPPAPGCRPAAGRSFSPVSTPQPRASGCAASNASRVRQRIPDSGCGRRPARSPARCRCGQVDDEPAPPPAARARQTAIVMSASPARHRHGPAARSRPRSPPGRRPRTAAPRRPPSCSVATCCAPVAIAAALPRLRRWRTTSAPGRGGARRCRRDEPSSTTTTAFAPGCRARRGTVAAIRAPRPSPG